MRKCSFNECELPVFGTDKNTKKGYCKKHQYLRTDIKKHMEIKSLKKRNKKLSRNKQNFNPFNWGFENERDLFYFKWNNSNKKSQISLRDLNVFLNTKLWYNCFAHILDKKKYPLFRYNPDNILVIHPYEHYIIDFGTLKDRMNYIYSYPQSDFHVFYNTKETLINNYNLITNNL